MQCSPDAFRTSPCWSPRFGTADARSQISLARRYRPFAGLVAMIAVLFILLVTLAGLGIVVVNALSNSPWGVFTIGMTIPIALIMGWWMFKSHAGTDHKSSGPAFSESFC